MNSVFLSVCYLTPFAICLGRRIGLVAKAETVESDVAPCHNCAKVDFCWFALFWVWGFFCDKSFNLSISVLQL